MVGLASGIHLAVKSLPLEKAIALWPELSSDLDRFTGWLLELSEGL